MKKFALLLSVAALLFATSCTDKNAYTVTGKVADAKLNGKEVYLQELSTDGQGFTSIDTTTIENGTFSFKGKTDSIAVRFISVAAENQHPALFILEAGNIEINIDSVPTIKGTPMNDQYQIFANKSEEVNKKLVALGSQYQTAVSNNTITPELMEKLQSEGKSYSEQLAKLIFDYTKTNMQNPVGEFFFMASGAAFSEDQLRELLTLASPKFKKDERIQQLEKQLKDMQTADKNTIEGSSYIDVKGKTPEGKETSLSEYVGKSKIVLVDFWASWCGPCIKDMPQLVEMYKKYKSKGLEIVGISLDEENNKWVEAIAKQGITWPQMSDLKGWSSELAVPYGVQSIPYTILLDSEGKIIAANLRGEELTEKIAELLK